MTGLKVLLDLNTGMQSLKCKTYVLDFWDDLRKSMSIHDNYRKN